MIGFIIEFLLSIGVCALLAYYFFLSAPVEDDVESDLNSSQISHDRPQRPVKWWESLIIYWGEESAVAIVYQHIRVSILGLDNAFLRSPTVRDQARKPREAQNSSDACRGGFGKRQRFIRQQHAPRSDLQGTYSSMRKESALWVNVVSRWLGILILGGGTVNIDVWSDRLQYTVECGVACVNRTLMAKTSRVPDPMTVAPVKTGAVGRYPHVDVLHLELGPSLNVFQKSVSGIATSTIDAMQRNIKESSNLASTWAAVSAKVVKNISLINTGGRNSTIRPDKAPVSANNFLVDESKVHDCPGYTGRSNISSSSTGSFPGVGVAIPRLAGDIVSVELPSFTTMTSDAAPDIPSGNSKPDPAAQAGAKTGCDAMKRTKSNGCIISPSEQAQRPSLSSEVEETPVSVAFPFPLVLRCFSIPICYEDHRFSLDLGCCFPILSFLPAKLCIPADVLCIDCVLQLRHVSFLGSLYAAFHGSIMELSFPSLPRFNASFEVTAPQHYLRNRRSFHLPADPSSSFTTTSTTRNVTTSMPSASSPSLMMNGNFGASNAARLPSANFSGLPLPPSTKGFSHSCINGKNEKMQELVQLALQNAVRSITYPNVLEAHSMSFVYEARLMPFGRITEKLASSAAVFFEDSDSEVITEFKKLPLWNRCMLAAVIPVILQRHQAQHQQQGECESDMQAASDGTGAVKLSYNDLQVSLKIVNALDDLEVAAERIRSTWADEDEKYGRNLFHGSDSTRNNRAPQGCQDYHREDEIYMDRVLREHLGSDNTCSSSCSTGSNASNEHDGHNHLYEGDQAQEKDEVDIAMCFNLSGVSLGMGNASLFGGHGYHPLQTE